MFNVINDRKFLVFAAACAVALTSCDSQARRDQEAAQALVDQAQQNIDSGNYENAIALIDSIDRAYPSQVECRRSAIPMRAKALKGYSEQRLMQTDSLVTVLQASIGEFTDVMHHVKGDADLDGYYVVRSAYNPEFASSPGMQVRVSDLDYSFYIVASSGEKRIGVNQIVLSSPQGEMASTAIPEDSPRAGDTDAFGSDIASFRSEEVADLAAWAADNASSINRLVIKGSLGEVETKLSSAQTSAISTAWRFADIASRLQQGLRLKEKLEKQLVLARDQELNLE